MTDGTLYYPDSQEDQRFFFPLIPFVAGLAIGPLLFNSFNRPCFPPYPPAYPQPYPYPMYAPAPGYPTHFAPMQFNQSAQTNTPVYGGITENVNIYTK
nr:MULTISPECIES: hypothetical protein [Bacillus]